eukprot:4318206-Amphidinium_carterae.1
MQEHSWSNDQRSSKEDKVSSQDPQIAPPVLFKGAALTFVRRRMSETIHFKFVTRELTESGPHEAE